MCLVLPSGWPNRAPPRVPARSRRSDPPVAATRAQRAAKAARPAAPGNTAPPRFLPARRVPRAAQPRRAHGRLPRPLTAGLARPSWCERRAASRCWAGGRPQWRRAWIRSSGTSQTLCWSPGCRQAPPFYAFPCFSLSSPLPSTRRSDCTQRRCLPRRCLLAGGVRCAPGCDGLLLGCLPLLLAWAQC